MTAKGRLKGRSCFKTLCLWLLLANVARPASRGFVARSLSARYRNASRLIVGGFFVRAVMFWDAGGVEAAQIWLWTQARLWADDIDSVQTACLTVGLFLSANLSQSIDFAG
ncbi:hypothetical protein SRHO_G00097350 [Serrasalmus rhombeus]